MQHCMRQWQSHLDERRSVLLMLHRVMGHVHLRQLMGSWRVMCNAAAHVAMVSKLQLSWYQMRLKHALNGWMHAVGYSVSSLVDVAVHQLDVRRLGYCLRMWQQLGADVRVLKTSLAHWLYASQVQVLRAWCLHAPIILSSERI